MMFHFAGVPFCASKKNALFKLFYLSKFNHAVGATTEQFYLDFLGFRKTLIPLSNFPFWNWLEQNDTVLLLLEELLSEFDHIERPDERVWSKRYENWKFT
jgi:hypothetical protein